MKKRKYIVTSILIILIIVAIVSLALIANAENNAVSADVIEDEKTMIRTTASVSRLKSNDGKVHLDTMLEEMNKYAGSGKATVTQKDSNTVEVTFVATGNAYEVNVNKGPEFETDEPESPSGTLPSTAYTTPYLPSEDFEQLEGTDLITGLVIQDDEGNQYVWIEVPRTASVYDNLNYDLDSLTGTALTNAYTAIETDLHEYTSTYRNGTSYKDEYYSDDVTGLTSTQYTEKKQKMLKSIYENGGFYVGRYEAGIATNRTSHTTISETLVPTSKENQYPLTYVYCSEAQTLASRVLPTGEHTSSLMFGVQWDLVLRYLQSKGASTAELNSDSTEWGNYNNSTYTLNRGNYRKNSTTWPEYTTDYTGYVESSIKKSGKSVLYTTGASDQNRKQNIYDLAGNVYEWTLEYTSRSSGPCASRGGRSYNYGNSIPASYRFNGSTTYANLYYGFRVVLY